MKVNVLTAANTVEYQEWETPVCPQDGVLVKILACGVCGSDLRTYQGMSQTEQYPLLQGHEVAARVIESRYPAFPAGTHITFAPITSCGACWYCRRGMQHLCDNKGKFSKKGGPGGFAEYSAYDGLLLERACFGVIPEGFDPVTASLAETASSVLNCHTVSGIAKDDLVLVIGSGAIGSLHREIALLNGASEAMVIELSNEKVELARSRGFEDVYNYSSDDPEFHNLVMEKTEGRGADTVICACPSVQAQADALRLVRKQGKVIFFGGVPKSAAAVLDTNLIHYREINIHGAYAYSPEAHRKALGLITSKRINAEKYITHRYPLDQLAQAYADMKAGKTIKAVIVLN